MDSIDLQVLKEAVETLKDYEGQYTFEAVAALQRVIDCWDVIG